MLGGEMSVDDERIAALEAELAALRRQMPAHSVPPSMLMRLEEIEDELAQLKTSRIEQRSEMMTTDVEEEGSND